MRMSAVLVLATLFATAVALSPVSHTPDLRNRMLKKSSAGISTSTTKSAWPRFVSQLQSQTTGHYPELKATAGYWGTNGHNGKFTLKAEDSWVYALEQRLGLTRELIMQDANKKKYAATLSAGAAAAFYGCRGDEVSDIDLFVDGLTAWIGTANSNNKFKSLADWAKTPAGRAGTTKWLNAPGKTDKGKDERSIQLYMPQSKPSTNMFEVDAFQAGSEIKNRGLQDIAKQFIPVWKHARKILKTAGGPEMSLLHVLPCEALVDMKLKLQADGERQKDAAKKRKDAEDLSCLCKAIPNFKGCKGVAKNGATTAVGCA